MKVANTFAMLELADERKWAVFGAARSLHSILTSAVCV